MDEKERMKRGLKPRMWIALYKCIRWTLSVNGVLFALEVRFTSTYLCYVLYSVLCVIQCVM